MVCLTNIPTPYRLHFFHALFAELQARGGEMEVWFMAKSEPGRYWQFKDEDFRFRHRFFSGINFSWANIAFHLNPGIPVALIRNPPRVLLVAGGWGLPTNILTALQAKLLKNSFLLFWSESHLQSSTRRGWFVDKLRALLLRLYDGFAVPGQAAAGYVRHYNGDKPLYDLPNTVEEGVFRDKVRQRRLNKNLIRETLGIPKQRRVLLLPARLTAEKGILPFLAAIASLPSSVTGGFTLLIAGDGPLREPVGDWVAQHPSVDVRVLGHKAEDELVELYAVADAFTLPSLSDPNPLAVIEALWAGLPLILSDRVGNHPEALVSKENGWLFNPECAAMVREVLAGWLATPENELGLRGRASARIAEERFATATVVKRLLNQLFSEPAGNLAAQTPGPPTRINDW